MMRRLMLCAIGLAACGDNHLAGARDGGADAGAWCPVPPDATQPAPSGTVIVEVARDGMPLAGATIVVHDIGGGPLLTVSTDADGRAQIAVERRESVTAIDLGATPPTAWTIEAVAPGEVYRFGERFVSATDTVSVALPPIPAGDLFAVESATDSTFAQHGDTHVDLRIPPGTRSVNVFGALVGTPPFTGIAWSEIVCGPVNDNLAFPALTPFATRHVTLHGIPADATTAGAALEPTSHFPSGIYVDGTPNGDEVDLAAPVAAVIDDEILEWQAQAGNNPVQRGAMSVTDQPSYDLTPRWLPWIDAITTDPATRTTRIATHGPGTIDGTALVLQAGPSSDQIAWRWTLLMPGGGPTYVPPGLPSQFQATFGAQATMTAQVVLEGALSGGYDALRTEPSGDPPPGVVMSTTF